MRNGATNRRRIDDESSVPTDTRLHKQFCTFKINERNNVDCVSLNHFDPVKPSSNLIQVNREQRTEMTTIKLELVEKPSEHNEWTPNSECGHCVLHLSQNQPMCVGMGTQSKGHSPLVWRELDINRLLTLNASVFCNS